MKRLLRLADLAKDPRQRRRIADVLADPQRRRRAIGRVGTTAWRALPHPSRRPSVRIPQPALPDGPENRPGLTAAVILDPFSALAFRYEWNQLAIRPEDWSQMLSATPPDLLFVESAWNGNDGAWRLHMTRPDAPSDELRALTDWCRQRGVPTVFWNKEDPPNYERFLETAKLFDQVFTVDAERLPAYRADLGHDRVALLPFAAQPRVHNPIQRGNGREHGVAFAGTYFADKHPLRRAQMDYVLDPAREFGLHIYSRMQHGDARYRFPARFVPYVVGSLPYEQMLGAYGSYKVFLNVNSVTESPSMCARRLFEISAAQTPIVTAPAASVEPFFGDTVAVVADAEQTSTALGALLQHPELRDRTALQAHRQVFDEHLFTHRVGTVLAGVGIPDPAPPAPGREPISAVVATNRPHQLDHVLSVVGRQRHPRVQLVLVHHGFDVDESDVRARAHEAGVDDVVVRPADSGLSLGACLNLGIEAADGVYVAKMDDDNLYGEHYLTDLVRAFSYTDAEVVGKWAHYAHLSGTGTNLLRFPHAEHRYVRLVQGGTIVIRRETIAAIGFADLPRQVDTTLLERVADDGGRVYSADRFNFVSMRDSEGGGHTWTISDQELLAKPSRLPFYGDPRAHVMV